MNWPMALIVMTAIITVGYVVDALIGNRSAYRQGYTEGYVEGYERGELKQWDGKRKNTSTTRKSVKSVENPLSF